MVGKKEIPADTKDRIRRLNVLKTLDLDETISLLQAYLDGKMVVGVLKGSAPKGNKTRKKTTTLDKTDSLLATSLDKTDLLLASISLIGERIINKYRKGEYPHYERMMLWEMSLRILTEFVELGILSEGREIDYIKNGYFFRCISISSKTVGDIVLPLDIPMAGTYDDDNMPDIKAKRFEGLNKSAARKIILEYMAGKQFKAEKWVYVYIMRCADDTLYTGLTNDIPYRLYAHNAGKGAKYTKSRLPVKLVYWETFGSEQEAARREYQIKRLTRAKKLKLINEH